MVLSAAIDKLPADYRAVVVLRDVEGLSHREIAETLGLTVVNVKTRVHRARLFLRKQLDAHLSGMCAPLAPRAHDQFSFTNRREKFCERASSPR